MISTTPVSAFHCLLFAIALGSSLAEYDAEALGTGNARSNTILSCFLIAVFCMVGIIFLWTLRKEIHGFFVKCWTTTGADRSSENQAASTLNDIIFDPEEEQQATLSESLLPSSS